MAQEKERLLKINSSLVKDCPDCDGSGYKLYKEGVVYRCDCMVAFRYIVCLVFAYIPHEYWFLDSSKLMVDPVYTDTLLDVCKAIRNAPDKGMGLLRIDLYGEGIHRSYLEVCEHAVVNFHRKLIIGTSVP